MTKPITYSDAGVDIDAATRATDKIKELAKRTFNERTLSEIGSFGGKNAPQVCQRSLNDLGRIQVLTGLRGIDEEVELIPFSENNPIPVIQSGPTHTFTIDECAERTFEILNLEPSLKSGEFRMVSRNVRAREDKVCRTGSPDNHLGPGDKILL